MNRRNAATRASALWTATLSLGLTACGGPPSLVVANAGIIDGTGAVWEPGRLVVVDGLVSCVGAETDCPEPGGAEVLDATGFWVVPGLIDVRAGVEEGPRDEQPAYLAFLLGVTTAAAPEAPPTPDGEPAPPAGSDDRRIPAPRVAHPVYEVGPSFGAFEAAIAATLPRERQGLHPREPRDLGVWTRSGWALADREALLDSARAMGARGLSLTPRLLEQELWAGPYRLPHGMNRLLEHPMVVERIQDRLLPDRTAAEAEALAAGLVALREFVREFHAAGGSVSTATAGVLAPGLALHEEMDALVTAGLSPEDAIYAATRQAARALGLEDSRGTLEVGKLADFIILEGDPRLDISLTQTVSRVAKGGVLYDPPTLFDTLLDRPGNRVSDNPLRLLIGAAALLLTLAFLGRAVRSHRRSMGPRLVQ